MEQIYEQIARRTGGDVYIGVVGPVRTGKSTFIKRFMEINVLPQMTNQYKKERARDELPQSGSGKTIMTAEPKFVPEEAAQIELEEGGVCRLRLVDCVGYMIPGALGQMEDEQPRMVNTPWQEEPMPMKEAAEIGTEKVIREHSTVGLLITTDGSVTEFEREEYLEAEERAIGELKALGKPFLVILNSQNPGGAAALNAKEQIESRYQVSCTILNCQEMEKRDAERVLGELLYQFPAGDVQIHMPRWIVGLPAGHPMKTSWYRELKERLGAAQKMQQMKQSAAQLQEMPGVQSARLLEMNLGTGQSEIELQPDPTLLYQIISEQSGLQVQNETDLMQQLTRLSGVDRAYSRIRGALEQAAQTGYGIVMPQLEELTLEAPEIVRQGGRYGVKLRAAAPSIHLIRANIQTEVSPIVGSEKQSEELVDYLLSEFQEQPEKIWESNIFGKSLHELVSEGLNNKLNRMPEEAREKLQETLERIINDGSNGLICIIL